MGGALTPFVVIPIMAWLGWRAAFWLLGGLGIIWAVVWYVMYRDPQKDSGSKFQASSSEDTKTKLPWNKILHNRQFWTICAMYFFYAFGSWFFFSWFPTFMELGRGFAKSELTYAVAVPFIMSMIGNITGGYLTDKISAKYGLKVGRKALGTSSLAISAVCMFLAAFIPGKMAVFVFLSLCFGIFDLMLPSAWALCIDLGKQHAGAISGAMNTFGNVGGFFCGILFGYLVQASGNYNLPLYMIAGMLLISAVLFSFINPEKPIIEN
jgi:predicted MFS family arabinose efflux permease